MSQQRHLTTTNHLLDTAAQILIDGGEGALTLDLLARSGHSSIGSVYERWSSREDLLKSLLHERVLTGFVGAPPVGSLTNRLHYLMDTDEGRRLLVWVVEFLHVTRNDASFVHAVNHLMTVLADYCQVGDGLTSQNTVERGTQLWLCSVLVGHSQLRIGGARMPELADAIGHLASRPQLLRHSPRISLRTTEIALAGPRVPPQTMDDKSRQIIGVTRQLLSETSHPPTIRAILGRLGVSTKVLYRRFESQRELMLSLLHEELERTDTAWGRSLAESLSSADPIGALANVFRIRLDNMLADSSTRNVVLGLTAQARTNAELRAQIIERVEVMADVRAEFFESLSTLGVLHQRLTPNQCGWFVQLPAAGLRLMIGAGIKVSSDDFEAGVSRVLWNAVAV